MALLAAEADPSMHSNTKSAGHEIDGGAFTVTVTSFDIAGLHPTPSHEYIQRYCQLEIGKFVGTERVPASVPVFFQVDSAGFWYCHW
jgi:hypothetical protein